MEPSREFRFAAKRTKISPSRDPDFLADVARRVLIADDAANQAENRLIVASHEHTERFLVAGLRAANQLRFGNIRGLGRLSHGKRGQQEWNSVSTKSMAGEYATAWDAS
jgi:hypothetical protein